MVPDAAAAVFAFAGIAVVPAGSFAETASAFVASAFAFAAFGAVVAFPAVAPVASSEAVGAAFAAGPAFGAGPVFGRLRRRPCCRRHDLFLALLYH